MATRTAKESNMKIAYEENGISKEREANAEELAYIQSAQADAAESKKAELSAIKDRATAKAALLEKLNISSDEAKLLLA